jgi:general secretion pathway protein L
MALLVILLPAPPGPDDPPPAVPPSLSWVLSPDGLAVARQGHSTPALWPPADSVVAVVPAGAVAWHRPLAPRAPAGKMRAALGGVLEEQLLDDDDAVHLALAPRVTAGAPVWVAAIGKPWLQSQLAVLASAGFVADRLVPAAAPLLAEDGAAPGHPLAPQGHFHSDERPGQAAGDADALRLALADADGALCLPLAGGLARTLATRWASRGARFSATPVAAAAAERWLGTPVAVRSEAEHALAAVRSPWNLLQFDLTPQRRGTQALARLGRQLLSPAWRPARYGLAALLALHLLGLNLMAWQQQRAITDQRAAMETLLRRAHPQLRAVLDAPVQMQRETAALRSGAGVPGDDDLEPMLAAAAGAWPDGQAPATQLRYEPGRLSVVAAGWGPPQVEQMRQRLQGAGWALDSSDGQLSIRRASPQ